MSDAPRAAPAPEGTLPSAAQSGVEPRLADVWMAWLGKLATDAAAAQAAAMAYKELDAASREAWLGVLEHDAPRLEVPPIAVYAPLLAVEADPARRARITAALGPSAPAHPITACTALVGRTADGHRVAVLTSPLYLDFVQVLACRFKEELGFRWVRHDPIVERESAPRAGQLLEGVKLEAAPLQPLVDDLALAILAHVRGGAEPPEALRIFSDLFTPEPRSAPVS